MNYIQHPGKKYEKGFSLIELMVVIGIFTILMSIAVPNFFTWRATYRFKKACGDLYGNIQLARSTAIKEHTRCNIAFNQAIDGTTYDYVVFAETLPNGSGTPIEVDSAYDAGEKVLAKVQFSDYENVSVDSNDFSGSPITYLSTGMPTDAEGTVEADGSLTWKGIVLENTYSGNKAKVEVTAAGLVRITNNI